MMRSSPTNLRDLQKLLRAQGVDLGVAKPRTPSPRRLPRILPDSLDVSGFPARIQIKVGGVPSNWANDGWGGDIKHKHSAYTPWREMIGVFAMQACRELGLAFDRTDHPRRLVSVDFYRCGHELDWDGSITACKPIVDGLVDGYLLRGDKPRDLHPILVNQERVAKYVDEYTRIEIRGFESEILSCPHCARPF